MRISFYAYDLGPAKNLAIIANEAIQRAHRVAFVGNDELGNKDLFSPMPDVLATSISSFRNEEELELGGKAGELGIPWIVVADTHYVCVRPAAKGKVTNAVALVASLHEIDETKKFGYQRVEYFGCPPKWQEFPFIKPALIKRQDKEKIILIGGIKDGAMTDSVLAATVSAMNKISRKWRLIFKPHSNEWKETVDIERRNQILKSVNLLEVSAKMDNLLGSVDLSIHISGATATIAAAYLRLPVVCYEDEDRRKLMIKAINRPDWFPSESGACAKATPKTLKAVISELLTEEGRAKQRKIQEEVYPLPEIGGKGVEEKILDFIEQLV